MSLAYAFRLLDRFGTVRTFSRLNPPASAAVPCMLRRADEVPLAGDSSQYDVQFFVRAGALADAGFPVPPVKGDRILSSPGETHVVKTVEPLHDDTGVAAGFRLWCRGH